MVRSNCFLPHDTTFAKALTPPTSYQSGNFGANTVASRTDFDATGYDQE